MKVQGLHTYQVSRTVVWQALMDPSMLAGTLPGCDELIADGENAYKGVLNVRIGPVQGTFAGRVHMANLVPPERFEVRVRGEGPAGFLDGNGQVRLEEAGAGTALHYDLTVHVGGRVANVGQRLLESTARAITRQALDGLASQIIGMQAILDVSRASLPGTLPPVATTVDGGRNARESPADVVVPERAQASRSSAAPSQAQFAAGVVREMLNEALPARPRRWLVVGLALLVVLWVVWRVAGQ